MDTMNRLWELLNERDISLYKLSQISGVSYSTLRTTDKRGGQLSIDTISLICDALGINMRDFFSGEDGSGGDSLSKREIAILREMIKERGGTLATRG